MLGKWKLTILSAWLTLSFLSGCNADKRNELNEQDQVDFRPITYDPNPNTNLNESNNDFKNRENKSFSDDETPRQTDLKFKKGDALKYDKNSGVE
jgi:hypothetical protein